MLKQQGGFVKAMNLNIKRLNILNRYYLKSGFYPFLKKTILKTALIIALIAAVLFLLEYYFIDINGILNNLVYNYKPWFIFLVFFASESVLGLLPPPIFIAWCAKMNYPWFDLFAIASVSYLGGCVAYFLGRLIRTIPPLNSYLEHKASDNIKKLQKWGGLFIMVAALLPVPFSIVSTLAGVINYKFKHYYLWSIFRYGRFIIYAIVIFKVF